MCGIENSGSPGLGNEHLLWFSGLLDVDIVVGGYAPFISRSHEDLL